MAIVSSACRALADQLEGNEEEHEKYRRMVVQYIEKNRELFEPFIEDDVPFDEYCQSMGKDGTWAGHMELQAATLVTHTNICIHRHMSPRWYIRNFDDQGARMIHLSYHDGEHYNSLRLKEDQSCGPAKPIVIKADDNLTASAQQPKSAGSQSKAKHLKYVVYEGALKMVMAGSGCDDAEKVEQVLLQVDGDVDAATEFLIAEQEAGETLKENGVCHEKDKIDEDAKTKSNNHVENIVPLEIQEHSTDIEAVDSSKTSSKVDKKIPNNKVCPCGSKKKHKACCGAASGKTCSKVVVDNEVHARRGKRMKQRKKVIPITKAGSCGSNSNLPDMGALCI
ncbi:OTU domain-containing protein 3-like isoform X2 [Chenopodium quinoa]|uniref:OTU domain-containing protein 3-like isoform X2 n=1 Tax=Chenopodium quinoa TaxID=63459 RepID=UPI000B771652|nr:OTU domain-containing protein 3-like isoform X2 [Chenopodium quinoa]